MADGDYQPSSRRPSGPPGQPPVTRSQSRPAPTAARTAAATTSSSTPATTEFALNLEQQPTQPEHRATPEDPTTGGTPQQDRTPRRTATPPSVQTRTDTSPTDAPATQPSRAADVPSPAPPRQEPSPPAQEPPTQRLPPDGDNEGVQYIPDADFVEDPQPDPLQIPLSFLDRYGFTSNLRAPHELSSQSASRVAKSSESLLRNRTFNPRQSRAPSSRLMPGDVNRAILQEARSFQLIYSLCYRAFRSLPVPTVVVDTDERDNMSVRSTSDSHDTDLSRFSDRPHGFSDLSASAQAWSTLYAIMHIAMARINFANRLAFAVHHRRTQASNFDPNDQREIMRHLEQEGTGYIDGTNITTETAHNILREQEAINSTRQTNTMVSVLEFMTRTSATDQNRNTRNAGPRNNNNGRRRQNTPASASTTTTTTSTNTSPATPNNSSNKPRSTQAPPPRRDPGSF